MDKQELNYIDQKERVRIANLVARKPELQKVCCICGKPANILHNVQNPYYITFICNDCRKNPKYLQKAEKYRFDIRTQMDKTSLSVVNFTDKMITEIVENYLLTDLSIEDYCQQIQISRYQFNKLLDMYLELYPDKDATKIEVKLHSNDIQRNKIVEWKTKKLKRKKRK